MLSQVDEGDDDDDEAPLFNLAGWRGNSLGLKGRIRLTEGREGEARGRFLNKQPRVMESGG